MKRLLFVVVSFFLFSATEAKTSLLPDSSRINNSATLETQPDTTLVPVDSRVALISGQNLLIKRRLDSITKDVPFDYNEYVQGYINLYMERRDDMARILGLTKYYFPIYEKAFREAGIPEDIKFLSIIESELNPNAVSRVGATGPWQFMYETARAYGLNIDSYIDERRDPIQASYAAAAYLKDAYHDFGDWLVAIASYNCGKGNVLRAIQKAGGATDFWSIRPFLPAETRGYVPAYIAMTYIMNYYKKHNIEPLPCSFSIKTDTLLVNKYVSLGNISQALGLELKDMAILNPEYKRLIVNGSVKTPRRLVIPQTTREKYSALYSALNDDNGGSRVQPKFASYTETNNDGETKPAFHKVKKGETLADIADNYGVTVQDLKVWNDLHRNRVSRGTLLRLTEPSAQAEQTGHRHSEHKYITYKVRRGDTISTIADKFDGTSVEKIKELNRLKNTRLQPGMTLKINHV